MDNYAINSSERCRWEDMRRLLALTVVLVMVLPLISVADETQGPLGWAVSAGGFEDETLAGHVVLDDGSIVAAGSFTSAALFDEIGVGAEGMSGDTDMFVAVMNTTGNWTSAFSYGSAGADGIDAIALHTSGDLILVGHFCLGTAGEACEMNMSSFTLNKSQDNQEGDAFIGRFALSGNSLTPIWVRTRMVSFMLLERSLAQSCLSSEQILRAKRIYSWHNWTAMVISHGPHSQEVQVKNGLMIAQWIAQEQFTS